MARRLLVPLLVPLLALPAGGAAGRMAAAGRLGSRGREGMLRAAVTGARARLLREAPGPDDGEEEEEDAPGAGLDNPCGFIVSCAHCAASPSCGWCEDCGRCLPGGETGPQEHSCSVWGFDACSAPSGFAEQALARYKTEAAEREAAVEAYSAVYRQYEGLQREAASLASSLSVARSRKADADKVVAAHRVSLASEEADLAPVVADCTEKNASLAGKVAKFDADVAGGAFEGNGAGKAAAAEEVAAARERRTSACALSAGAQSSFDRTRALAEEMGANAADAAAQVATLEAMVAKSLASAGKTKGRALALAAKLKSYLQRRKARERSMVPAGASESPASECVLKKELTAEAAEKIKEWTECADCQKDVVAKASAK